MNGRIKELIEQSGLSHMPSNYPDMADLYKGADFELEKFAQLLIQECCLEIAEEAAKHSQYGMGVLAISSNSIARIKQRFGVV